MPATKSSLAQSASVNNWVIEVWYQDPIKLVWEQSFVLFYNTKKRTTRYHLQTNK